jgi:hypothetical protein
MRMTNSNDPTVNLAVTGYQVNDRVKVADEMVTALRGARLITPAQAAAVRGGGVVVEVEAGRESYPKVAFGDGAYGQTVPVPAEWLTLTMRPEMATSTEQTSDGGLLLGQLGREIDTLQGEIALATGMGLGSRGANVDLTRLGEVAASVTASVISIATLVEAAANDADLRTLMLISLGGAGFKFDALIEPYNS